MAKCIKCSSLLGNGVEVCPICGAGQPPRDEVIDNVTDTLTSSPSILNKYDNGESYEDKQKEIERLVQRGDECFSSGKAWLGAKDRTRARKEFQRAFKYYETVLKMDPNNARIREARSKCLFKMA
ncbi:hypothetical protein [[Eubacterium] cellulosolvens]